MKYLIALPNLDVHVGLLLEFRVLLMKSDPTVDIVQLITNNRINQIPKMTGNQTELDSAFSRFHKQSFFVSDAFDEFGLRISGYKHVSGR